MEFRVPYGKAHMTFHLPDEWQAELIAPVETVPASDPMQTVNLALNAPVGRKRLTDFVGVQSVAIAVNDKTRPVPHKYLLPPLLRQLEAMGIRREAITFIVAIGTHLPMSASEFAIVIPPDILERYGAVSHDPDDKGNLVYLGETQRSTPVWVNRRFAQADLRIVVGNIEPHQFQGFSGGYKTAAIGLAGKDTVNHNHAMMTDPNAEGARAHIWELSHAVREVYHYLSRIHAVRNAPTLSDLRGLITARTALSTRRTALVERLDAVQVTRTLSVPL